MPRTEAVKAEVERMLKSVPFRSFVLALENDDLVPVKHPENIAFEPTNGDGKSVTDDFYMIADKLRVFNTFSAVTSVALLNCGETGN